MLRGDGEAGRRARARLSQEAVHPRRVETGRYGGHGEGARHTTEQVGRGLADEQLSAGDGSARVRAAAAVRRRAPYSGRGHPEPHVRPVLPRGVRGGSVLHGASGFAPLRHVGQRRPGELRCGRTTAGAVSCWRGVPPWPAWSSPWTKTTATTSATCAGRWTTTTRRACPTRGSLGLRMTDPPAPPSARPLRAKRVAGIAPRQGPPRRRQRGEQQRQGLRIRRPRILRRQRRQLDDRRWEPRLERGGGARSASSATSGEGRQNPRRARREPRDETLVRVVVVERRSDEDSAARVRPRGSGAVLQLHRRRQAPAVRDADANHLPGAGVRHGGYLALRAARAAGGRLARRPRRAQAPVQDGDGGAVQRREVRLDETGAASWIRSTAARATRGPSEDTARRDARRETTSSHEIRVDFEDDDVSDARTGTRRETPSTT